MPDRPSPQPAGRARGQRRLAASAASASAPRTDPTVFALGSLGWKAFQDLCGTILGEILGQTVMAFRPTRDAGRDYAFEGTWAPRHGEALAGHFVIQCKFKAPGVFYPSDLSEDLPKVRRLVRDGRCDSYVLMTNGAMTAESDAAVRDALRKAGVVHSLLIGGDQIDRYLKESSRLRALVPRLYGLGDLTQILDERRYEQALALLATMRENLDKFVVTKPYGLAVQALIDHGFVLLLGAPAAGKSMIASALAAGSIDMWGCRPMKVESSEAFVAAWNPFEPRQLFWIDDAFGSMQYQRHRTETWNQHLSAIRAAIGRGARFVMTSRDYIWAEAAVDLKKGVLPPLESGQVVVDVHDLTTEDKSQILYNHLRYGNQPKMFRTAVKPYLEKVADLDEFLPEVARRLGDQAFTTRLRPVEREVLGFFMRPLDYLREVVGGLGPHEFAALALIFMSEGSRSSPIELSALEDRALARLGSGLSGVLSGLHALRGSLVVLNEGAESGANAAWSFKHPTIGDAVRQRIAGQRELLQIYLRGTPVESLLDEIACGDKGPVGALVVPPQYHRDVVDRLVGGLAAGLSPMRVAVFLVDRCDATFIAANAGLVGQLDLPPQDHRSSRVAARFKELGCLGEERRRSIVEFFETAAIDQLDMSILTDSTIRALLSELEAAEIDRQIREEVIPDLASYLESAGDNYDGSEAPEELAARLHESLEALAELYGEDPSIQEIIDATGTEVDRLEQRLLERSADGEPQRDWDDDEGWRDRRVGFAPSGGSIFSDVDD